MSPPSTDRIVFGSFTLDTQALELWQQGARLPLEPLPAKLLARLVQHSGALVSRRDLLRLGWGDAPAVTDQALNTCIHEIRQALGHAGDERVRLETLRGRGYRLCVAAAPNEQRRWSRVRRLALWFGGLAAGAAVVMVAVLTRDRGAAPLPEEAQHYSARARYLAEETQDLPAARAVLDSARKRFPQVAALHAQWSEVSSLIGALDDARAAAELALRLDSRQVAAYRTRAMIALLQGDWSAADAALDRALALDASDTRTIAALAFRHAIHGRFEETDRWLRKALAIDPLSAVLYRDAGFLYLIAARYADADRYCRAALRLKPNSVWATDCLFDVAVLTKQMDQAAAWGRRLMQAYDVPAPSKSMSAADAVAVIEAWRLAGWIRAVGRGADPFGLALAYAANGRVDESIGALSAAAQRPGLGLLTIAVDPRLAILRQRPAFADLLQRLKLAA